MLPDSDKVARLIAEVAAEEVMPYFEKLGRDDIREKKPGDIFTIADVAAERRLTPLLTDLLPGSRVVGEEAVAADPTVLDALADTAPVWLVDPIDGTANFAAGTPIFAVMVALVRDGQTIMSWIHEPVTRRTASAVLGGEGAWRDGKRLRVAPATGSPPQRLGNRRLVRRLAGGSDLVDEVFEIAAPARIRHAGERPRNSRSIAASIPGTMRRATFCTARPVASVARLDGSPYTPRDATPGLLLAPDAESWAALREALIAAT